MRLPPPSANWQLVLFHLAHGLVAFGVAYGASYFAVMYSAARPGSPEHVFALGVSVTLVVFELAFLAYLFLRRGRVRALWRDARALATQRRFAEARELLLRLLPYTEYRLRPEPLWYALAAVSEGMEDWRGAALLYRRCGNYPPALLGLGVLMLLRGANDRAAEALRKFTVRVPGDLSSAVMLSMALYRGGKVEQALNMLKVRLRQRPASALLKKNIERLERGEEPSLTL